MFQAFTVLRERSLLLFFSARSISLLGNAMGPVALSFAVLDMRGASATTLGLVLTARGCTQVFFYLVGGAIVDRFARHRVMVLTDLLAALAQGGVALVVISGSVQPLILAALVAVGGGGTPRVGAASRLPA